MSTCNPKNEKPANKILDILILGGGPVGLFVGYKLLKKNNNITIFEKRKKYTRHNILSLQTSNKLDTLSIIPSEIIAELNQISSFANITQQINKKKCSKKNVLKKKPYLMASSKNYYIVLNELEMVYEKHFKERGGVILRPENSEAYSDIRIVDDLLLYSENGVVSNINISKFDIVFVNDGANSYYRNIYFEKTSYVEDIEYNIFRYGLKDNSILKADRNVNDINPLSYGMILIYDIQNKEDFQDKFNTEEKLEIKTDFDSIFKLTNIDDKFLKGMTIKEILINNTKNIKGVSVPTRSQNLLRMFVSENYLYISIMVNSLDAKDFTLQNQNKDIKFDNMPSNLQIYLMFALYYYDLSELIDLKSPNVNIKLFPLFFSCVKQSCTFIKRNDDKTLKSYSFERNYSEIDLSCSLYIEDTRNSSYQLVCLCGDAMASGNFHAGIVLNKNLLAANNTCLLIDEYTDSYPKNDNGDLDNDFLRLMFFHVNLSNQEHIDEIIKKSIDALIDFHKIDEDKSVLTLPEILAELGDTILCQNCKDKEKLMCKNSNAFVKFIIENLENEVLQRVLKYLFSTEKLNYVPSLA